MGRYKEWSRRKKGVAGIIAATFLFAMIFTTGFAYFMFVQYNYQLQHQAAIERNQMDFEQSLEQFEVTGCLIEGSPSKIGFIVNNTGSIPIIVVSYFVNDNRSTLHKVMNISPPLVVNSGAVSGIINTDVNYDSSREYTIKIVTARGNTGLGFYPPLILRYMTVKDVTALVASGLGSLALQFRSFRFVYVKPDAKILGGIDQSGYSVKSGPGYPAYALTESTKVMLLINVTNYDPDGRTIVLDSRSVLSFGAAPASITFSICKGYDNSTKEVIPYSAPITIPYLSTVTLNFTGSLPPQGSDKWFPGIFLILYGYFLYPDGATSPYGQTLPFQATTLISSKVSASLSKYFGATNEQISVSYSGFTSIPSISWIRADGAMVNITYSKTPLTFKVPDATLGYYAIVISDGTNTVYATFRHT